MKKLKSIISDLILQRSGWYLFFLSVQLASMLIAEKFMTINKEVTCTFRSTVTRLIKSSTSPYAVQEGMV